MSDYSKKIKDAYNQFDGKNLDVLDSFYSAQVKFTDPVTTCQGLDEIKRYYSHAYKNVQTIHFDFHDIFHAGLTYGVPWTMKIRIKGLNGGREFSVAGFSHLLFNDKGLVTEHRDYLDLGDMVYERLPLQGPIIRFVKRFMKP